MYECHVYTVHNQWPISSVARLLSGNSLVTYPVLLGNICQLKLFTCATQKLVTVAVIAHCTTDCMLGSAAACNHNLSSAFLTMALFNPLLTCAWLLQNLHTKMVVSTAKNPSWLAVYLVNQVDISKSRFNVLTDDKWDSNYPIEACTVQVTGKVTCVNVCS